MSYYTLSAVTWASVSGAEAAGEGWGPPIRQRRPRSPGVVAENGEQAGQAAAGSLRRSAKAGAALAKFETEDLVALALQPDSSLDMPSCSASSAVLRISGSASSLI